MILPVGQTSGGLVEELRRADWIAGLQGVDSGFEHRLCLLERIIGADRVSAEPCGAARNQIPYLAGLRSIVAAAVPDTFVAVRGVGIGCAGDPR